MSAHAARTESRREAVPAMAVALAFATARSTRSGSSVAAPPGSFSFLLRNLANAAALFVAKAPPGWANLENERYCDEILFSEEIHSRINVQIGNHVPSILLRDIIHDISSTNITTWSNELVNILRPNSRFNFFSISRSIHFSRYMYIIGIAAKLHPFQRKLSRFRKAARPNVTNYGRQECSGWAFKKRTSITATATNPKKRNLLSTFLSRILESKQTEMKKECSTSKNFTQNATNDGTLVELHWRMKEREDTVAPHGIGWCGAPAALLPWAPPTLPPLCWY